MDPTVFARSRMREPEAVGLDEALRRARRVVSHRTGIVTRVHIMELWPDDPPLHWVRAEPAVTTPLWGGASLNPGSAASIIPERALIKAIGESIERYCGACWNKAEMPFASWNELGEAAIPPETFELYEPWQECAPDFPFAQLDRRAKLRWTRGYSLVRDCPVLVPACFVHVPYEFDPPAEPAVFVPISTGLACAPTLVEATVKGILELIERDAFSIAWHNRLSLPALALDPAPSADVARIVRLAERAPFRIEAVNLSLDLPGTVVLVVLRGTSPRPPFTVLGLGTDMEPSRALFLALEEAHLGFLAMRRYVAAQPRERRPLDPGEIVSLDLHGLAHAIDARFAPSTRFLTASTTRAVVPPLRPDRGARKLDDLREIVDHFAHAGLDLVAVDLTTSDVDDAGFKVVRVVSPGLRPLDIDHNHRFLGGSRIRQVPVRLGVFERPRSDDEWNPDPHPFP